jgi:hypothetical protein
MSKRDARTAAEDALNSRDWSGATVVTTETPPSSVYSVRLPAATSAWLMSEADRRGVKPGTLLAEFVAAARSAAEHDQGAEVTVRVADLHAAIDQIAARGKVA